jgi:hypothetical protein
MIEFMILGLPRSGTTWAANLFTTDKTICLHDPLYLHHYTELDAIEKGGKCVGVSCTGLYQFPNWVNTHPAKKIKLYRSAIEINESLAAIGLSAITDNDRILFDRIEAPKFHYSDLFDPIWCAVIADQLGVPFDADRHAELVQIEMQPKFSGLKVGADVTRRLVAELTEALK